MERKVPTMEISISAARADIVRYYEDRGYSHAHSEAYVPHDADQVMRIYNIIQKENGNDPAGSQCWSQRASLYPEARNTGQILGRAVQPCGPDFHKK